jgi:aerobic C4-dicarboxylate transport protein
MLSARGHGIILASGAGYHVATVVLATAHQIGNFVMSIANLTEATVEAHSAPVPTKSTPFYKSLFLQVLVALVLGVVLGVAAPGFAASLKILSDAFLKLISMIVAPIVFCVVVHGIAGAGDLKKVGRVGVKALIYFEVMTTIALIVGLVLAIVVGPGHGMNIDTSSLDASAISSHSANARNLQGGGVGSFILNIIPTTSFDALARNDVLQVLFFAVLFGVSLALVGEPAQPLTSLINIASIVLFRAMGLIVRVAPLGVLGAVAYTVGRYGVGSLKQLLSLLVLVYLSIAIFVLVVLGAVMRLAGLSILKFLAYLREELTIVLGTASSDAVLPQIMRKLEWMGVKKSVVGLVIPTGYSFNLDAFSIYLTLATVFIAQATNTPLSLGDLLLILAVSLVTSKGAHGVPGSAIVILAATLNAVPSIPAIGLVLVLSVDWFIGMARALGNLIGNCVATVVIAAWEKDLDVAKAEAVLNGRVTVDVTAG